MYVCVLYVHIKVEPCNLYIPSLINNHFTLPLFSSEHTIKLHMFRIMYIYCIDSDGLRSFVFMDRMLWLLAGCLDGLAGLAGWAGLTLVLELL